MTSNIGNHMNLGIYNRPFVGKSGVTSSAPNITNAENKIQDEITKLEKRPITTLKELEEGKYRPKVNSDGLFTTCGLPYTGILQNKDGALVEYKDGKPVTIVKSVSNGDRIEKKLIKYEYPEGSIAALKTETSVLQETNYKKGQISYKVPPSIQKDAGII